MVEEVEEIEETTETEADKKPKIITVQDTLDFAEHIGLRATWCPYEDDIVNTFVRTINHALLNVGFSVLRVNPQCLEVLVGHPMTTIDAFKELWDSKQAELEKANKYKKDAQRSRDAAKAEIVSLNKDWKERREIMERDAVIGLAFWNTCKYDETNHIQNAMYRIQETRGEFDARTRKA